MIFNPIVVSGGSGTQKQFVFVDGEYVNSGRKYTFSPGTAVTLQVTCGGLTPYNHSVTAVDADGKTYDVTYSVTVNSVFTIKFVMPETAICLYVTPL